MCCALNKKVTLYVLYPKKAKLNFSHKTWLFRFFLFTVNGAFLRSRILFPKSTLITRAIHKQLFVVQNEAHREIEFSVAALCRCVLFLPPSRCLLNRNFQQIFSVNRSENETAAGDVLTQNCRKWCLSSAAHPTPLAVCSLRIFIIHPSAVQP